MIPIATNAESQTSQGKGDENGKRQKIIFALFLLAVISIAAFFILWIFLDRLP